MEDKSKRYRYLLIEKLNDDLGGDILRVFGCQGIEQLVETMEDENILKSKLKEGISIDLKHFDYKKNKRGAEIIYDYKEEN